MGFELAIPAARTVCMVEREAFAVAHLVAAMRGGLLHGAPVWSDAGTFNGRPWRGVVDCVIGGIPCQPHSQAGKRQGREDERDLWSDARRIIVQTGARFVLIENVSGMLSTGGAARVVGDLQRLGFLVEGGLFTAQEVGFSHRRERCFMLAYRAGVGLADACGEGSQGLRPDTSALGREDARRLSGLRGGAALADAGGRDDQRRPDQPQREPQGRDAYQRASGPDIPLSPPGPGDLDGWRRILDAAPELEPAVCRVADELADGLDGARHFDARTDRLRLLGNGVVPLEAAHAVRTLSARLGRRSAECAAELAVMGAADLFAERSA